MSFCGILLPRPTCSPDNSSCEGFFGRIKNEMFYNRDWHAVTLTKFEQILDEYLNWCAKANQSFTGRLKPSGIQKTKRDPHRMSGLM